MKTRTAQMNKNKIFDKSVAEATKMPSKVVADWIVDDCNVCLIFSCPGKKELEADRVCSGKTGVNLDGFMLALVKKLEEHPIANFPKIKLGNGDYGGIRYSCNIINASNFVHCMDLTGDTEPKNADEIYGTFEARNIDELIGKKDINYYIIFGEKAKILFDRITTKKNYTYAQSIHLSDLRLNTVYPNSLFPECKTSEERRMKRCELLADKAFEQLLDNVTVD